MSKQRFSELMDDLGALYDKDATPALKRIYWADLGEVPIDVLEAAVQAHRRDPDRGRYFPKPADIIAKMPMASELTANEAWGLCMASFDETDSVLVSDAIMRARSAALPMWSDGDKIGARMAFRDAYDRALLELQAKGARPIWSVSIGHDKEKQKDVVNAAVASGLLSRDAAAHYLPPPDITPEGAAIAGLLTGSVSALPSIDDKTRERLAELKAVIAPTKERSELMAEERDRFENRRRNELRRLDLKKATGEDIKIDIMVRR